MATAFNQSSVAARTIGQGVERQALFGDEPATASGILIDRLTLAAGASTRLDVSAQSIAWLMVLDGEATAKTPHVSERLSEGGSIFLPPRFDTVLSADRGATVISAEIPDVRRVDPGFAANTAYLTVIDWAREAVFDSERDTRKRIPVVCLETCGVRLMKIEMVIYPSGTAAPNHRCEGADTFIYVLAGRGTAHANEQSFALHPGDLVHVPDREWHDLQAGDGDGLRFLQFNAPGTFKTVWADPGQTSGWTRGRFDILGRMPAPEQRERRFGPWTFYD